VQSSDVLEGDERRMDSHEPSFARIRSGALRSSPARVHDLTMEPNPEKLEAYASVLPTRRVERGSQVRAGDVVNGHVNENAAPAAWIAVFVARWMLGEVGGERRADLSITRPRFAGKEGNATRYKGKSHPGPKAVCVHAANRPILPLS